jgi:phage terminase large subunit GpA-like protein
MHWYEGVRDDFFPQLLGEMKVPSRRNPAVREWKARTDRRHEVLDCTVGAVWLSRQLRLHLKTPAQWLWMESQIRQASLLTLEEPADEEPAAPVVPAAVTTTVPPADVPAQPPPPVPPPAVVVSGKSSAPPPRQSQSYMAQIQKLRRQRR